MQPLILDPALFPIEVSVCGLRLGGPPDITLGALRDIAIPAELKNAVPSRRVDFAAGRYCAREALRVCSPASSQEVIAIGAQREPCWPAEVVGGIAHTRGYALAAVARAARWRGIGVDVERWLDDGAGARIGARIATDDELRTLVAQTGWTLAETLTAVFSAKETIYKCLFPEVKRYFGFSDAWVDAIDVGDGSFHARLSVTLTDDLPAGMALHGRFERHDEVVITALALERR